MKAEHVDAFVRWMIAHEKIAFAPMMGICGRWVVCFMVDRCSVPNVSTLAICLFEHESAVATMADWTTLRRIAKGFGASSDEPTNGFPKDPAATIRWRWEARTPLSVVR